MSVRTSTRLDEARFLGTHTIQPFTDVLSREAEETHVRDIEESGVLSSIEVFVHHRGVPDWQFESMEIDEVPPTFDMGVV